MRILTCTSDNEGGFSDDALRLFAQRIGDARLEAARGSANPAHNTKLTWMQSSGLNAVGSLVATSVTLTCIVEPV